MNHLNIKLIDDCNIINKSTLLIFSGPLTILLPPILTSSNANTWLSTRSQKRNVNSSVVSNVVSKVSKNDNEDLSKWLSGGRKQKTDDTLSEGKNNFIQSWLFYFLLLLINTIYLHLSNVVQMSH